MHGYQPSAPLPRSLKFEIYCTQDDAEQAVVNLGVDKIILKRSAVNKK